jgi:hypothetical protein
MVFNVARAIGHVGIEMMPITVAVRCFTGYKYTFRLALIAISHSFTYLLGFSSLLLLLTTMEDKRGTKRPRSPSQEGSSSPSSASTPLLVPSGSTPPPGSPSEVCSRCHCSPVFEQGRPSEKIPVVDLSSSSDEDTLIPYTSWDVEFTKRLFGDLNRGLLGPSDDDKIIILSDSNEEEEEMREESAANAEAAPFSTVKSPAPTASAADADDVDKGTPNDSNGGHSTDRAIGDSSNSGDKVVSP